MMQMYYGLAQIYYREQTLAQLLSSHSRFLNLIDKRQEISDALGHYRMTVMGLMVFECVSCNDCDGITI